MDIAQQTDISEKPKVALLNDPKVRNTIVQVVLLAFICWVIYGMVSNAAYNLEKAGIASGFGFLNRTSGFGINFSPFLDYSETSTYSRVYWVGLQNTLMVAVVGIILATIIGFIVGVARLSSNWVVNKLAYCYVEGLRNVPLLLQIFIWYKGVSAFLPSKQESHVLGPFGFLDVAGLTIPKAIPGDSFSYVVYAVLAAIVISWLIARWARKRQMDTGQQFPVFWTSIGLIVLLPLILYYVLGRPLDWEYPVLGKFGLKGGFALPIEYIALVIALSTYTAAFIAEIVRAGILAINKGQTEAAYALGLRSGPTLRLAIIPQAMRVIIPPLTSQYLNITKNSSLAVAIAYQDLTSVFAGIALNQTGQAVEILFITMMTYLAISLFTSLLMNWYNSRMALIER
jgi:general L-amino acid transport system permease protein